MVYADMEKEGYVDCNRTGWLMFISHINKHDVPQCWDLKVLVSVSSPVSSSEQWQSGNLPCLWHNQATLEEFTDSQQIPTEQNTSWFGQSLFVDLQTFFSTGDSQEM